MKRLWLRLRMALGLAPRETWGKGIGCKPIDYRNMAVTRYEVRFQWMDEDGVIHESPLQPTHLPPPGARV